jgi:hypothetical protein
MNTMVIINLNNARAALKVAPVPSAPAAGTEDIDAFELA